MKEVYLRVGSLVRPVGKLASNWRDSQVVLRVAKRKKSFSWSASYDYFVVGVGDPVGHGVWCGPLQLRQLNALELLAQAAE